LGGDDVSVGLGKVLNWIWMFDPHRL